MSRVPKLRQQCSMIRIKDDTHVMEQAQYMVKNSTGTPHLH